MDRSFLSQPAVIAASRAFVCVRLATYEDPLESMFTKALVRTGSGEVENTAFCLLAPDGKKKLSRSARGMDHLYDDAAAMAARRDHFVACIECPPTFFPWFVRGD